MKNQHASPTREEFPLASNRADNDLLNLEVNKLCSHSYVRHLSARTVHFRDSGQYNTLASDHVICDIASIAEMLRLNGYSTSAYGKWHETAVWEISPSGPFDRWPNQQGFDEFYGFLGGETNQWAPAVYHNQNRVETPNDPDYHFMNDMATQAIKWIRFQQALTPDKPFFT